MMAMAQNTEQNFPMISVVILCNIPRKMYFFLNSKKYSEVNTTRPHTDMILHDRCPLKMKETYAICKARVPRTRARSYLVR